MVLKLGNLSNFRNLKLGGILHKKHKYSCSIGLSKYIPNERNISFLTSSCLIQNNHFDYLRQVRSIYIPSKLCGKVLPFKLSDIGEGIVEVTVKEWFVKPGDKIAQFDNICEVQSDKASVTITSRYDGIVKKLYYQVDETAFVGKVLIDIEVEDEGGSESDSDSDTEGSTKHSVVNEGSKSSSSDVVDCSMRAKAIATPAVRRIAKENNVNIQEIRGTGKDGRVLKEDILAFIDKEKGSFTRSQPPPPLEQVSSYVPPKTQALQLLEKDKREQITGFKKAMVKSMENAWKIPHFSYCDEVVITELVKMKDHLKRMSETYGVKFTYMPFFIKAASLALLKYPQLNSHVDDKCEYLTTKAAHNIGIAMDTQNGLIVPNIKNVQLLSIVEITMELNRLQTLGNKGQLGLNDLKDGTFTLSNIGSIGGTYTKPIIFSPQVIIGALGKVQVLPRFDESKNLTEMHIFYVSWSADHRVIDGAMVARFSNLWKAYLSSPKLLLEL
ncbi:hypothetical protein RUM44_006315 [Polyplax serrata]|uniref:Dihydrolipoamide acetyltransferase component of pyruvate dehydrogenase complex n=1 Tax=Polyplax serrata TaxID=468196 RepID=A0ABR1AIG4_POLSC